MSAGEMGRSCSSDLVVGVSMAALQLLVLPHSLGQHVAAVVASAGRVVSPQAGAGAAGEVSAAHDLHGERLAQPADGDVGVRCGQDVVGNDVRGAV